MQHVWFKVFAEFMKISVLFQCGKFDGHESALEMKLMHNVLIVSTLYLY